MNNSLDNIKSGKGRLAAKVTTAGGSVPVQGAVVHIKPYEDESVSDGDILYSLRTDEDGMTGYVTLDAPPSETSLSPDSNTEIYSMYNMVVNKEGYYTVENIGIPIFDGVSSVQPVTLLPLTEDDNNSPKPHTIAYYESGSFENLRNGTVEASR